MADQPRPDGRSRRWAAHRDTRRIALVEAAAAAVEEHGPDLHLDDIAAAAGITKPVLYRYFGSKDEVLAAAALWGAERILESMTVGLSGSTDARSAILAAVDAYLREVEEHRNLFLLVIRQAGPVGGSVLEGRSAVAELIARALANGLRGSGVPEGGVAVWSHAVVGMGLSSAEWWLASRGAEEDLTRDQVATYLADMVWHAFAGLRRDRADSR